MVTIFNKKSLDEAIEKNNLIVIDFYAVWCGPCVSFANTFEEVAKKYDRVAVFGKVNIDESRDLAVKYRISSIPTIVIIKNREVVWQHIGSTDEHTLSSKVDVLK